MDNCCYFSAPSRRPWRLCWSRLALRARLGSAQAQADQQVATIAKLRAELAATHERLARQAAHFMGEMRRIGTGGTAPPAPGQARLPARVAGRNLAERVAQATRAPASRTQTGTPAPRSAEAKRAEPAIANGRNGKAQAQAPAAGGAPADGPAAAQMPNAPGIPAKRRRPSLIDRLTGLGKS